MAGLITAMMGFERISPQSSYLGLSLFKSHSKKDFSFLLEKLDSKLARWKARVISKAKQLVLIKSVAFSMPIYAMQSMKVLVSICSKMEAKIRNFWWSSSKLDKPLCLKAWKDIFQPKKWDGLGFWRMQEFN